MVTMVNEGIFCSLLLFKITASSAQKGIITVGMESTARLKVDEDVGAIELCAAIMGGELENSEIHIPIAYEDRSANAGTDFLATPRDLVFNKDQKRLCFLVQIIDDDVYEKMEEFFVNLTTNDPNVYLHPKWTVVVVADDDVVTIGWEKTSYTVDEWAGQLIVKAKLTGTLEDVVRKSGIMTVDETAIVNKDYILLPPYEINFLKGSNSSSTISCNIKIIKDVEYEGDKSFFLEIIRNYAERLILDPQTTEIVIRDYNVIHVQKPRDSCEGLQNLISTSNESCTVDRSEFNCLGVQCIKEDWQMNLTLDGCSEKISVGIQHSNSSHPEYISVDFTNFLKVQEHNFSFVDQIISVAFRNVFDRSGSMQYYLLDLEVPFFNLSFPQTAIPYTCNTAQDLAAECHVLPLIDFGKVRVENPVVHYICEEGYALLGDGMRICQDGTWSGREPRCVFSSADTPMKSISTSDLITFMTIMLAQFHL